MSSVILEMSKKHTPFFQNFGSKGEIEYCNGCKTSQGLLTVLYPCDVVKVLNEYRKLEEL